MCQSSGQLPEPPSLQEWGVTMVTVSGCSPAPCLPLLNSACVYLRRSICSLLLLSHDQRQKVRSCNSSQPPFPETVLTTDNLHRKSITSLNTFPAHHLRVPTGSQQRWLITKAQNECLKPGMSLEVPASASASATREACCKGRWSGTLTAGLCTHTSLGGFQNYLVKQYRCHP